MWKALTKYFQRYPAQTRVAQTLLRLGLSVREDGIYCAEISIPDTSLARACNVDRRVISATVKTIREEPDLQRLYGKLRPTLHLKDAATELGWGVLEIIPTDAHMAGILAEVATIVAAKGISVRQAIVDDPELTEEPRLYIVTEKPIPMDVIPAIKSAKGVRSVVIQ
jgi:hypothetical protein